MLSRVERRGTRMFQDRGISMYQTSYDKLLKRREMKKKSSKSREEAFATIHDMKISNIKLAKRLQQNL